MIWLVGLAIVAGIAAMVFAFIISKKSGFTEDMSEKEAQVFSSYQSHEPFHGKSFGKKKTLAKADAQASYSWAEIGQGFREKNPKVIFTFLGVLIFILLVFWIVIKAMTAG